MGRREIQDKNVRKISRRGGGVSINIPLDALRELKWRIGQKVVVKRVGKKLIIEDWE